MPPPYYNLLQTVTTKVAVPARVCQVKREDTLPWYDFNWGRGYHKISLPIGCYEIREVWRDLRYYHDPEHSDGYTYRLRPIDRDNPLFGKRISVWQNDLDDAIEGFEEEETVYKTNEAI